MCDVATKEANICSAIITIFHQFEDIQSKLVFFFVTVILNF